MRKSKELVYPVLRRYESNELSRNQICADLEMSTASFWYWLRKYREETSETIDFIELEKGYESAAQMEIYLGDARIVIQGNLDVMLLRRLVGAESIG